MGDLRYLLFIRIAEPMSCEERYNARQTKSKPVLEAFYAWLDTVEPAGGSNLAKAVQYAKNEKRDLCRFLESGDIPIDNNRAENAIRPMCVGRRYVAKPFMFCYC